MLSYYNDFFPKSKTLCLVIHPQSQKEVSYCIVFLFFFLESSLGGYFKRLTQRKKFSNSVDIFCNVFVVWHGWKYISCQVSLTPRVERNISVLSPKCSSNCPLLKKCIFNVRGDHLAICDDVDGPWDLEVHYAKWDKSSRKTRTVWYLLVCGI